MPGRPQEIEDVFAAIGDPAVMRRFFREILTDAERRDLALRWRLMARLHQGLSQREVSQELGVSLCKITRGSRILKQPGSVSRALLSGARPEPDPT